MRITELRVLHERFDPDAVSDNTRGATVSDLVAALREAGVGEVLALELDEFDGGYGFADENGITVMPDEGTYLVVRIDGEGL